MIIMQAPQHKTVSKWAAVMPELQQKWSASGYPPWNWLQYKPVGKLSGGYKYTYLQFMFDRQAGHLHQL